MSSDPSGKIVSLERKRTERRRFLAMMDIMDTIDVHYPGGGAEPIALLSGVVGLMICQAARGTAPDAAERVASRFALTLMDYVRNNFEK